MGRMAGRHAREPRALRWVLVAAMLLTGPLDAATADLLVRLHHPPACGDAPGATPGRP
jgi:hypothetical protein